jgi:hypothetical protein
MYWRPIKRRAPAAAGLIGTSGAPPVPLDPLLLADVGPPPPTPAPSVVVAPLEVVVVGFVSPPPLHAEIVAAAMDSAISAPPRPGVAEEPRRRALDGAAGSIGVSRVGFDQRDVFVPMLPSSSVSSSTAYGDPSDDQRVVSVEWRR